MSTGERTLLVVDDGRWVRDCARADHPTWDAGGCYCREVTVSHTSRVLERLTADREPRRIRLRILGRGR